MTRRESVSQKIHSKMVEYWSREAQNANRAGKHLALAGRPVEAQERRDYERYAQAQITIHQFAARKA